MKHIKHIFFDLDHTLWDFDKNSGFTFEKIFQINGLDIDLKAFLSVYEPINFQYWKLYREERVTKAKLRYGRLKDAFDAIDVSVSDAIIDKLSEDYITYLTTFNHVFEGTFEILDYLKDKYQLHIITNGFKEAQEKKLEVSGLKDYFITVTNSEMVGVKKPNPKIFNYSLNAADAFPKESLMIGDNLEADIEGAVNVGMEAIFFDYANRIPNTEVKRITFLLELMDFL
ncbi:MAG: noncanonical pyrimidine nucleotidase, YjjG family [Winogradskyella sp.]|uniref:YjjG family noncanonical pyrimidine nucleotidase n=1 Tax=Winogradskyella sp. TaxID=1883156 RepID=UPI000F3CA743|nr:YjjG family noncanonical pyrimidine nucleotidase [Winogradskyella sp.]RNC83495.1 MAG: noncanonical pyrimidine nucleotidase, YjjG family [Winogradskyella sp.]